MFSKVILSVLVLGLSIMAVCFTTAAFFSLFLMFVVMSSFPSCYWHYPQIQGPFSPVLVVLV